MNLMLTNPAAFVKFLLRFDDPTKIPEKVSSLLNSTVLMKEAIAPTLSQAVEIAKKLSTWRKGKVVFKDYLK